MDSNKLIVYSPVFVFYNARLTHQSLFISLSQRPLKGSLKELTVFTPMLICSVQYGIINIKLMFRMFIYMYAKIINLSNKIITYVVYAVYPFVLILLMYNRDPRFWRVLLAPSISFVLVSIFRKTVNAPRPYEVTGKEPIIEKDTEGNSFPSRHVFSVFVIASTLYFISAPLGILLMLFGIVLAVLRVIGGVHFARDVIAGAIIGILSGIIGFCL